jgi:hypothetical protein
LHLAVIVAVGAVRMMQVAIDEIVGVAAVRDRFVSAGGAMAVAFLVSAAIVVRRACLRIVPVHVELMLFHAPVADMMEMPVMQVVDMSLVFDGRVAAVGAVLMFVVAVHL